ncbi:hypothetical protein EN858_17535 [Mesorhizobium sp. M4B.F.Ca.ET.215.01.1.1]|uniref:hypothetical protein n=1 Tax=unclassified Mesorhizobium TaxID=325217 RepID=UPI000FCBECBB|nr:MULTISPECIES: hypothetical protein [unclassified Mesorhizobium]RUW68614.1 hypothetical protein EOA31_25445 [Mesorhizobium sp. M4B.F.Ca.ET.049.02.1.2]TGQ10213.1 hypothetical protein EN858_17535 [Mesorhizobium sp. M4B.F.Ca.ET.215.01.1.1]TGQ34050.1 hypothetical protein EN863_033705 [Mesorhizobium sp. M00.F.Ca.ET.220.01.1.1]TGR02752.1 hypothetical protein EN846_16985 [Mesorhizobium sp. M4B.F.Ca.ET.203.01.1.1]TGV26006.1 hypothetical protein EN786_10680 [Mesorhizobium sp. M4B.F.Ca.ET.143.01.1.1]
MTEGTTVPDEKMEGRRERLYGFKTDVSAKLSDIVRFIGLGLVAIFYTIKTGNTYVSFGYLQLGLLYLVGLSGVFAILLDYIQYASNYVSVDEALNRPTLRYDKDSKSYRRAEFAFAWKQRLTLSGALALIALVVLT